MSEQIRIKIPSRKNYLTEDAWLILNCYKSERRPSYKNTVCLIDEIHEWLESQKISYKFFVPASEKWFLEFENKNDAMLFKLTWGGDI